MLIGFIGIPKNEFPTSFVIHAESYYAFDWQRIIIDLRDGRFFFPGYSSSSENVTASILVNRRRAALANI
jgi:hypothetical protein